MKRSLIVTLAALSLAGLSLAAAAPTTLTLNDNGIDYTTTGSSTDDTAYLSFSLHGNQLAVDLSDKGGATSIPAISFFVPGVQGTDIAGNDVYPTLSDISAVTTTDYGNEVEAVMVTHPDANLAAVKDSYLSALGSLGFTTDQQATVGANIDTVTMTKGADNVKLVFHRDGSDVSVYLTGA